MHLIMLFLGCAFENVSRNNGYHILYHFKYHASFPFLAVITTTQKVHPYFFLPFPSLPPKKRRQEFVCVRNTRVSLITLQNPRKIKLLLADSIAHRVKEILQIYLVPILRKSLELRFLGKKTLE